MSNEDLAAGEIADKQGILEGSYAIFLEEVLRATQGIERVLIECGARQWSIGQPGPENPAIAHHFALNDTGEVYFAYDPFCDRLDVDVATGRFMEKYKDVDFNKLVARLEQLSIPDFTALEELIHSILENDRVPVIFSKATLSANELVKRDPFWQLPGRHFHAGHVQEMCNKIGYLFGRDVSIQQRGIEKNPEEYLKRFSGKFLPESHPQNLQVRPIPRRSLLLQYHLPDSRARQS